MTLYITTLSIMTHIITTFVKMTEHGDTKHSTALYYELSITTLNIMTLKITALVLMTEHSDNSHTHHKL